MNGKKTSARDKRSGARSTREREGKRDSIYYFQQKRKKMCSRLFCMYNFFLSIFFFFQTFPLPWSIYRRMVPFLVRDGKKSLYLHLYYRICITHSIHDTIECKSWSIDSILLHVRCVYCVQGGPHNSLFLKMQSPMLRSRLFHACVSNFQLYVWFIIT